MIRPMTEGRPTPPIPLFDVKKWTYRMLIASGFAVALLVFADPGKHEKLLIPGIVSIAFGQFIRLWGTGHLHKNKVLATGGPYSFVRHPLYVGTFFIMLGLALISGSRIVLYGLLPVGLLVFFIYYAPKKERVESDRLQRKFGETFDRYKAAVHGYFPPRLTPYPDRQGRFAFAGIVENREYLIALAVAFGVAVILVKYFFPDLIPTPF
jgi:protein-S-isoprenylcysteine O-methyltransferase Ste14